MKERTATKCKDKWGKKCFARTADGNCRILTNTNFPKRLGYLHNCTFFREETDTLNHTTIESCCAAYGTYMKNKREEK